MQMLLGRHPEMFEDLYALENGMAKWESLVRNRDTDAASEK